MKVTIGWKNNAGNVEDQIKSFDSEVSAMTFCRKNYKNIAHINGKITNCEPVNHFALMDAINR